MRYRISKIRRIYIASMCILLIIASNVSADSDHGHAEDTGFLRPALVSANAYFSHIHGVAFLYASGTVALAAHDGLWLYEEGKWSHVGQAAHDYMGFAPFDGGFYAGGHPDLSTDLPNPLGLVKVSEDGDHVEQIRFAGEHDFHLIASGRSGQYIYLYNDTPSRELDKGLYYTTDYGAHWRRVSGYPVTEDPVQLSAHPNEESTMALIAGEDVYLTVDYGQSFTSFDVVESPTALAFHPDGRHLLIGKRELQKIDLTTGSATPFPGPGIDNEVFTDISVSFYEPRHIAAVTSSKSVWLTLDSGIQWANVLHEGMESQ